jgi:hypothetical protein
MSLTDLPVLEIPRPRRFLKCERRGDCICPDCRAAERARVLRDCLDKGEVPPFYEPADRRLP